MRDVVGTEGHAVALSWALSYSTYAVADGFPLLSCAPLALNLWFATRIGTRTELDLLPLPYYLPSPQHDAYFPRA